MRTAWQRNAAREFSEAGWAKIAGIEMTQAARRTFGCGQRPAIRFFRLVRLLTFISLLVFAGVAFSTARSGAAWAAGSPTIYFTNDPGDGFSGFGGMLEVRPSGLNPAGEDGTWLIDDVKWSSWGGSVARGTGISSLNNCNPDCVRGKRSTAAAQITLSRIAEFDGREVYDCIKITSSVELDSFDTCLSGVSALPPPVTTPPATTGPPTVTGAASAGRTLSCSGGSVTVHATRVVYRWIREGKPIPGAASRLYRIREIDEGLTLTCDVTAYRGSVLVGTVVSRGVRVAVPRVSGCPAASGSLKALLRLLGATRAQALGAFAGSSSSGQENEDFFCLTPVGVLVGYPPAGLLSALPAGQRGRLAGRVIWISTSNGYYSILRVSPGTSLAAAGRFVKLIGPFEVGSNVWYLAQDGTYVVVLIVRGGVVEQVGIADWSLAGGRAGELALIKGLAAVYRESIDVSGPLQALDGYWAAIGADDFAGAFGYLVPGLIGSEAGFVSSEEHEHVHSAQFQGLVTSQSGANATIRIVSLITHDQQFGCRTWSGSYLMTHRASGWRIARANIEPRPCSG
jgi:hypothetical protein